MMTTLRVIDIVDGTTVDGPGLRTSIYFAGCCHHCPGCQNPQSWDIMAGKEMGINEIMAHIEENDFDVTFSGGDPLFQIDAIIELAKAISQSGKHIWCYTGYQYEQVANDNKMKQLLPYIDVLVDGEFIQELRDIGLLFKGSSNQRLVDIRHSNTNNIVIWERE